MSEPRLTHVDETGAARMVDVSAKPVTAREATAAGRVLVGPEVVALLRGGGVPKGDAVAFVRHLGTEIGVAGVPGSSFYRDPASGRTKVRFCFCKKDETLSAAEERLAKLRVRA